MTDRTAIDDDAFKRFERDGFSRVAESHDASTSRVAAQVSDSRKIARDTPIKSRADQTKGKTIFVFLCP